ncbi:MAG: HD domain-containing protein [Clostridia bacterium]|nr:HD domain-containing protein [Clostridia bacterium]
MSDKEKFISIYKEKITREGSAELLAYLCSESCDFFTAPASTRFHGAEVGGLCRHSLNVYECLVDIMNRKRMKEVYGIHYSDESIAIAALLHDLCKINFYRVDSRNVKKNGTWTVVPYYTIDDTLPYGHGEKSVYIASGFMRLTRDEAFAIRYHMGFSGPEDNGTVGKALEMFPLAFALSVADMEAAYFLEGMPEEN